MSAHKIISFVKSGLRIYGLLMLIPNVFLGVYILIVAEILGIIEEIFA